MAKYQSYSTSERTQDNLLRELNEYVPYEPKPEDERLDEGDIPIDQITVAVAKRMAEAERKGLARLLDATKMWV